MPRGRPGGNPDRIKFPNRKGFGRTKGSKNKLTIARVEQEIRRLALMDPLDLFERTAKGRRTFTLREIAGMDADTRACISSIKVRTENLTAGDDSQDTTVEIKLWDKVRALEMCAKHFKWIEDKTTLQLNVTDLEDRLRAGRAANAARQR